MIKTVISGFEHKDYSYHDKPKSEKYFFPQAGREVDENNIVSKNSGWPFEHNKKIYQPDDCSLG